MNKMAASLWRFRCKSILAKTNYIVVRTLAKYNNNHKVVASEDGGTIVCWHPEVEFPYEKSLPVNLTEVQNNDVLKVKNLGDIMALYDEKKQEFVRQKLMDLTFTTKHRWFPEGIHKKRRRRNFEESRKYL